MVGSEHQHGAELEEHAHAEAQRAPPRQPAPGRIASAIGNRAFSAAMANPNAAILPDGTVHPELQATIARARGGGTPLDESIRERFGAKLGDPLDDVRIHADAGADSLARSVSARAFTTGSDLFFASGEYRPGSSAGDRLIAHELTHVVQQRGAPESGPMKVSDPDDPLEVAAETVSQELAG
jgi:Domain of unknown function (DUF4157)